MSNKGFTLIELLVVVSIISILSAIGFISYQTVIKGGRDGKRQSDLRSIQSALEQYHNDQGFYPFTGTINNVQGLDTLLSSSPPPAFSSSTGNPSPPPTPKTYLNSLPQDPRSSPQPRYRYEAIPTTPCDNSTTNRCTSYCLYANLENPGPAKPGGCTNASYNFAVTPP